MHIFNCSSWSWGRLESHFPQYSCCISPISYIIIFYVPIGMPTMSLQRPGVFHSFTSSPTADFLVVPLPAPIYQQVAPGSKPPGAAILSPLSCPRSVFGKIYCFFPNAPLPASLLLFPPSIFWVGWGSCRIYIYLNPAAGLFWGIQSKRVDFRYTLQVPRKSDIWCSFGGAGVGIHTTVVPFFCKTTQYETVNVARQFGSKRQMAICIMSCSALNRLLISNQQVFFIA